MTSRIRHTTSLASVIVFSLGTASWAAEPSDGPHNRQPTLDELLGIPSGAGGTQQPEDGRDPSSSSVIPDDATPVTPRIDPTDQDDPPTATGQPMLDLFGEAVHDMQTVSSRLGQQHDAGLTTQRLQESILAKIDQMIAAAKQQNSSSSSSSSSSNSSSGAQQQESGSAANAGQASSAASSQSTAASGRQPSSGSSSRGTGSAAGQTDGPLDELGSQWGNLPPRLRDQLQEGLAEPFTPLYQSLTQQYYRRLAQEGRSGEPQP